MDNLLFDSLDHTSDLDTMSGKTSHLNLGEGTETVPEIWPVNEVELGLDPSAFGTVSWTMPR